ncbi:MAG: hypothetical protein ACYTGB_16015 [Planctomycetota bacterium]|jgi:hypothetical protein
MRTDMRLLGRAAALAVLGGLIAVGSPALGGAPAGGEREKAAKPDGARVEIQWAAWPGRVPKSAAGSGKVIVILLTDARSEAKGYDFLASKELAAWVSAKKLLAFKYVRPERPDVSGLSAGDRDAKLKAWAEASAGFGAMQTRYRVWNLPGLVFLADGGEWLTAAAPAGAAGVDAALKGMPAALKVIAERRKAAERRQASARSRGRGGSGRRRTPRRTPRPRPRPRPPIKPMPGTGGGQM